MARLSRRAMVGLLSLAAGAPAGVGWWLWQRRRGAFALFRRLPRENLLLAYLDLERLRRARSLAPLLRKRVEPDPDYAAFVSKTGFDYERDLDGAAVCYLPDRVYILGRGRFDPARLREYALAHGGGCEGSAPSQPCRMPAGRPGRQISFLMPAGGLLALATAPEPDAVRQLEPSEAAASAEPLAQAVSAMRRDPPLLWATATPRSLEQLLSATPELSPNLALVSRALAEAERIYLFVHEAGGGLELSLQAGCPTEDKAEEIRRLLQGLMDLIGGLMRSARGEKPAGDWEKVLAAAGIDRAGKTVRASWKLDAAALESLGAP